LNEAILKNLTKKDFRSNCESKNVMPFALQAILLYRSNPGNFQSSMSLIVGVKQLDNDQQNFDQKSKIWENNIFVKIKFLFPFIDLWHISA
jgi:hypothetical protein